MEDSQGIKMLVLSLTGRCNFACKYCYAHQHPRETMPFSTAVRAVNLAAQSGEPFILQFSGGEPLLAFDVMEKIVLYVQQQSIPAIMQAQTNGSLFDHDRVDFLRQARVGIGVSLDGRPAVNDRLRRLATGEGSFRHILAGIQHLAGQGVEIGLTCVVVEDNVAELKGLVEMAYYLGNVRRIGFDLLRGQGRGGQLEAPREEAISRGVWGALQTARQMERRTGQKMLIAQLERIEHLARGSAWGFAHCYAMNGEAAFVDARGGIYACSSLVGDERFRLGDTAAGIDEKRRREVAAMIQNSMSFCRACPDFQLCGGGCFSRWYGSGCRNRAYDGECALKRSCIRWYEENREE